MDEYLAHRRVNDGIVRPSLFCHTSENNFSHFSLQHFAHGPKITSSQMVKNADMLASIAYYRYALDINLTDEQLAHPLIREAEGIVCGAICFFSEAPSFMIFPC